LKTWLLTHLESYFDFDGRMNDEGTPTANKDLTTPTLISTATLADLTRQSDPFHQVGQLYRDDPAFNIQTLVDELIDKQTVPLLPILRYKPSGLRKRADWEHTWHLQRQEDAGETVGTIPVPPKYATKDFAKPHYWKLRGKLDVPKERWVSFPHCEGPDGFPVIAWAGYDPLQLATAIANYYVRVQEDFGGSQDPRLTPLLACLLEVIPWVKQWHNQPNPDFNGLRMGDYYESFARDEAQQLGKTLDDIRAWQPPAKAKKARKTRSKKKT
ncbi:MAG: SAM-dependent methyltransferase, partial [Cyanobacteria bacterium J06649_4]